MTHSARCMKGDVAMPLRRTDDNSLHWPLKRTDDNSLLDCDVVVIDDFSQRRWLPGQPVGNGPGLPRVTPRQIWHAPLLHNTSRASQYDRGHEEKPRRRRRAMSQWNLGSTSVSQVVRVPALGLDHKPKSAIGAIHVAIHVQYAAVEAKKNRLTDG